MQRDFISNFPETLSVVTAVITADADGASVDLKDFEWATIYALVGDSGDTLSGSVYIELEVEESADDSSFTDVADADIQTAVTGTNTGTFAVINAPTEDQAVFTATYRGSARYVRPVVNVTGTHTNGTPIGVMILRHGSRYKPVA